MSHVVTIKTEIRDAVALNAACLRLKLEPPICETVQLFSSEATGHAVRLPEWRFPVVCDLTNGQIEFDNFGGRWGDQQQLDALVQKYTIEKTKLEARRAGHTVTEQELQNGSVKLTISVGEPV